MAATVKQENAQSAAEILPLDRYIRAVTICNNLALLASQGTVAQFLERIAVLSRLQRYWTKGFDTIELSCAEADALPPDSDGDDEGGDLASLVAVSGTADWEAQSDSTVDLKPDISSVVSDGNESASVQLVAEQNDGAEAQDDVGLQLPAKKRTRKVKRFTCQHCGEKFKYRYQLTRHDNHKHKQASGDAAASGTVLASGEAEPVSDHSWVISSGGLADMRHTYRSYSNSAFVNRVQRSRQKLAARRCQRSDSDAAPMPMPCSVCGKRFKYASLLMRHERSHWRERPDMTYTRRPTRNYACVVCGAQFTLPSLLAMHERRLHAPADRAAAAAAASAAAPSGDRRSCMCSECGRQFRSSSTLAAHLRTHSGERPYVCRVDGCTQRFAQHSTRSYHERTHSDAAPHVCTDCGRRFKHAPLLAIHARVHSGVRPYTCPDCPRAFSTLCRLKVHTRSHSGERPYACSQCTMSFNSTSGLRRHERAVHLGHKPFRCTVCDRAFTVPSNLRTHMRTHTGEKPFVCLVCGLRFSHSGTLKGHLQTHQRDMSQTPIDLHTNVVSSTPYSAAEICVKPL